MGPCSVQHQERIAAAAALLSDLWGGGLPPGPAPWQRIAADVIDSDDLRGLRHGFTVQGDLLSASLLREILSYVPRGASFWTDMPAALIDRAGAGQALRPL